MKFDYEGYNSDKKAAEDANDAEALKWLEDHKDVYEDPDPEDDDDYIESDSDSDDEE